MEVLKKILTQTQEELKYSLTKILKEYYTPEKVNSNDYYITAEGTIPIVLVAHMDTVFLDTSRHNMEIYYDESKQVLWSPQGLGTDDRAGIWIILQLIKDGFRPHIVFTTNEETGGEGAIMLAYQECPFKDVRYIIELDRMGADDCVFYNCDNPLFEQYIEKYDFQMDWGTFTDISFLCPEWKIAGVNLSVGYLDEHTKQERLFFYWTKQTLIKVKKMLQDAKSAPHFEYIPYATTTDWRKYTLGKTNVYS